ncbi:MAG: glycosyltransferase family 2 protein [Chloroflexi bacterium HGW-Chloroflexi-4]|nr:MAG: glycosyltransferase family 2 protein [Chloroflexi bacterium HGW-Chloroflexi-4]
MTLPEVSIVIPCLNEEKTILALLDAILHQTFPYTKMEVVISDGLSEDQTRNRIAEFQAQHPDMDIQLLDNPVRRIPTGLNQAIRAARAPIITRMDAHAIPASDYVERSVKALKTGLGDNVGGVIDVKPGADSSIAFAISIATAHPLGVGDAKYRWATKAGEADTVAFGTYFKSRVEEIGYYNEELRANEDYEFNSRLRAAGGKIWIDPQIRAVYYSRSTLKTLAKQYFTYGFWKFRMLRRNPETLRWRQALPPVFVVGILMLLLLSAFFTLARVLLIFCLGVYLFILIAASAKIALNKSDLRLVFGIPLAIVNMHFSWGAGFWWSVMNPKKEGI